MKILLFGATGQVGFELRRILAYNCTLICYSSKDIDLRKDFDKLQEVIISSSPDVIINASAYTAVDLAETNHADALAVNAQSVGVMARAAKKIDAMLFHYSTDYVFDGNQQYPYTELDIPAPKSVYGSSKLAGELEIKKSGCRYVIIRTSWVYSLWGNNFIKTIIKLAQEKESLNIVNDQFGAPTSASLLADIGSYIIHSEKRNEIREILHLTPGGRTSWHGLGCYVINALQDLGVSLNVRLENVKGVSTEEFPRPAARPKNSVLDTSKIQKSYDLSLPSWDSHIDLFIDQLIKLKAI